MLELSTIKYFKIDYESVDQSILGQLIKIFRDHLEEVNSPLPLASDEYNKKWILNPRIGDYIRYFYLAKDEKTQKILGMLMLTYSVGKNNRHICFVTPFVQPQFRKKKIAKNLINFAYSDIPNYVKKIQFYVRKNELTEPYTKKINEDLSDMLISKGGIHAFTERRSVSDITSFNNEQILKKAKLLKEKADEDGYNILFVTPKELESSIYFDFLKYISMIEDLDNDMPREESSFEDIQLDPELYLSIRDHFVKKLGQKMWTYVAIHKETGDPVGMTETWFSDENPTLAYQADTGVIHKHRGNGLGLALKYQMLARILIDKSKKNYKFWVTSNANSNKHMIKINDELRYEERIIYNAYEFDIDQLENYIK
jgi:predicted GNAT family acetyltransferase